MCRPLHPHSHTSPPGAPRPAVSKPPARAITMQPNLQSPTVIRELLERHGIRPRKRWGQNFLVDRNALDRILLAAELTPETAALEIGPGLGTLTRELSAHCRRVTAVEIDPVFVQILANE